MTTFSETSPASSNSSLVQPITPSSQFDSLDRFNTTVPAVVAKKTTNSSQNTKTNPNGTQAAKKKSRKRVNTAERRATHNAIERQRRETLNGKFLDLARVLPSLASVRRPSKSAIVNSSIAHLSAQRALRLTAARQLTLLLAERDELLAEVNESRQRNGLPERISSGVSKETELCLQVEHETFGTFAAGFGDDDDDEHDLPESELPVETVTGHSVHSGLTGGNSNTAIAATMMTASPIESLPELSAGISNAFRDELEFTRSTRATSLQSAFVPSAISQIDPHTPSSVSLSPADSARLSVEHQAALQTDAIGATDKVSSWAAEQLLNHLNRQRQHEQQQQQQQQPYLYTQQAHQADAYRPRSVSNSSAAGLSSLQQQHHAQNPYTASLLANIAATQQRANTWSTPFPSFGFPAAAATSGSEDAQAQKSYTFPPGPTGLYYPPPATVQPELGLWKNVAALGGQYASASFQQQQQPASGQLQQTVRQQQAFQAGLAGFPSMGELKEAVKVGMGYGLNLSLGGAQPNTQNTCLWDGLSDDQDVFLA